jgi:GT2 family glycosyltransferase
MDLASNVSVVIPTYNRWDDLLETLARLDEYGLRDVKKYVLDDCSSIPMPALINHTRFPNLIVHRSDTNQRQALGRNYLIALASAPFILHLDDDSFPLEGELIKAVQYLKDSPQLLALSFPVTETGRSCRIEKSLKSRPYPVQTFEGCAALIARRAFMELGGYAKWIVATFEESELTYRGAKAGYEVHHFPDFRICHRVSTMSRNEYGIAHRSFRNRLVMHYKFTPLSRLPYVMARFLIGSTYYCVSHGTFAPIAGLGDGLRVVLRRETQREPLDVRQYVRLRRLPLD